MEKNKSRFLKSADEAIYDSLTSLTWLEKDSRLDLEKDISWDQAQEYAKESNEKSIAGHNDWRIPSVHEATSLFDKSKLNKDSKGADINIDSIFPPGMANCTWTSETRGGEAQIIFYVNGLPYWYKKDDKTISHAVRLVRRD